MRNPFDQKGICFWLILQDSFLQNLLQASLGAARDYRNSVRHMTAEPFHSGARESELQCAETSASQVLFQNDKRISKIESMRAVDIHENKSDATE